MPMLETRKGTLRVRIQVANRINRLWSGRETAGSWKSTDDVSIFVKGRSEWIDDSKVLPRRMRLKKWLDLPVKSTTCPT